MINQGAEWMLRGLPWCTGISWSMGPKMWPASSVVHSSSVSMLSRYICTHSPCFNDQCVVYTPFSPLGLPPPRIPIAFLQGKYMLQNSHYPASNLKPNIRHSAEFCRTSIFSLHIPMCLVLHFNQGPDHKQGSGDGMLFSTLRFEMATSPSKVSVSTTHWLSHDSLKGP